MIPNDEAIVGVAQLLAADGQINLAEITRLIETATSPKEVLEDLQGSVFSLVGVLVERHHSIPELIAFIRKFAPNLDLNARDGVKPTTLHLIAAKNNPDLTALVLNGGLKFSKELDLYAVTAAGKTPAELAGAETAELFETALEADLVDRVALVTSYATNSVFNYLVDNEPDVIDWDDPDPGKSVVKALVQKDGLITKDGTIASHLNFQSTQYNNSFVDRPHSHWSWNQLCQANSGGAWEDAQFAVIEPLKQFSNIEGCAPYDTTIMGSHRLSTQASILVPNSAVAGLTARLTAAGGTFQGTVRGYDPTVMNLRQAIKATLTAHYPKAATLTNRNRTDISTIPIVKGENYAAKDYDFDCGHFSELSMNIGGTAKPLITGSSTPVLPAYRSLSEGKHVGLHAGSVTDIEKNAIMIKLKEMSVDPSKVRTSMANLAGTGGAKTIASLCVVEAFKIYQKLHTDLTADTGAHDFAEYLLKKALIADFRGYRHQTDSTLPALSTADLKNMVDMRYDTMIAVLGRLAISSDLTEYRATLTQCYDRVLAPPVAAPVQFSLWAEPQALPALVVAEVAADAADVRRDNDGEAPAPDGIGVHS